MAEKPSLLEQIVSNTVTLESLGRVNWSAVGGIWNSLLEKYPDNPLAPYLGSFVSQSLENASNLTKLTGSAYRDWLSVINIDKAKSQLLKEIGADYSKAKDPVQKAQLLTKLYSALRAG